MRSTVVFPVLLVIAAASRLPGDEGMWLLNRLPVERLGEEHGFRPDDAWARRVMRCCVRISRGGSGSVISSDGLVLTNHHVASGILQDLSTRELDIMDKGFLARSREEELRCPGTEIVILREIRDVTARVQGAVAPGMDAAAAEKARRARIAAVEREAKEETGLHCEVVTLYQGGEHHLYLFRRYDDIRLVMAPEAGIAFFGGDADNFEFPRHCYDMSLLRIYEDGCPARMEDHLEWGRRRTAEGDLVFVAGHPASTQRSLTVEHLEFLRDVVYPFSLSTLYRREIALEQYALGGEEQERQALEDLFGVQNGRKARRGILAGLQDPAIFRVKQEAEARLRGEVASRADLGATLEDWRRIGSSIQAERERYLETAFLERGTAFWSELFGHAETIVRLVAERARPSEERLPEFRDSALPRVEMRLFSAAPVHRELEMAKLADSLTHFASVLGCDHQLVAMVLAGRSPADRARELVSGTALADVAARRALARGGPEAVAASTDPMIQLARSIDPLARSMRERSDSFIKEVRTQAYANISRARFAVWGKDVYPDATYTLRLAFGVVKGWDEDGRSIPPFTDIAGAYRKAEASGGMEPCRLPDSWLRAKRDIDLSARFNFVCTADIIGGNSGSPVLNRDGEVVGLIFDSNIHGLVLDIAYTDEKARAVAVDAEAIIEGLRKVYQAEHLAREILGGPQRD